MKTKNPRSRTSTRSLSAHATQPSLARVATAGIGRGLLGGLVATAAMSAVMLGAQKAGLLGRMPPRKISDRLLSELGLRFSTPEPSRRALAVASHFAFGGLCGALFGLGREVVHARRSAWRPPRVPVAAGLAYGAAIWAVSYAGWIPALGIMPMPHADRPGRAPSMLLAHGVFGAVLAKLVS